MKKLLFSLACLISWSAARADITMTQCFSSAPNVFGSPSWAGYLSNALTGIQNGCAATGDSTQPTYYQSGTTFSPGDLIVTDYNSWKGQVNPPAPFNNELGNRLHDGLFINGNGSRFSLSELQFSMHSSDSADSLQFVSGFSASDSYSATRVGIIHTGSGDVYVTSGAATQLVDELVYVGIGNAFCSGTPADCNGSPYQSIDDLTAYMASNAPFSVTNTYSLVDSTGKVLDSVTGTANVNTPEPCGLALLGLGLLLAVLGKRFRRVRSVSM